MAGTIMRKLYEEYFDNEVRIETIMCNNQHEVPLIQLGQLKELCDKRTFLIKHIMEKKNG